MRRLLPLLALLAGCATATPPEPGAELRAEVLFIHRAEDLARRTADSREPERTAIESSGFAQAVREGRAVRLRCALGAEEVLVADAIAPPGLALGPGSLVRVSWGSERPVVPHRVLGPLQVPGLARGVLEREFRGMVQVLPWSATPRFGDPSAEVARDYAPVRSTLLLRCRPSS